MRPNEAVTKSLEFHGDFFHQRCLREIERAGWKVVDTEVPVHVAEQSSAADVWAEYPSGDFNLQVIIECKRSHPDFRVWTFLEDFFPAKAEFPVVYQDREVTIDAGARKLSIFSDVRAPSLLVTERHARRAHEVSLTLDEKKLKKEFEDTYRPRGRRPQGERIAYACYQLALAIRSLLRDEVQILQYRTWAVKEGLPVPRIYLPLLVTTAQLLYGSAKEEKVEMADGTIREDGVSYEEVPWLLYSYPLPEEMQLFPLDGLGNQYSHGKYLYTVLPDTRAPYEHKLQHVQSARGVTRYKRLPIIIVRGTALADCLAFLVRRGWSKVI